MRKKVLLAEESDTIRGVAESVLRQNGFEVISVPSGNKALEVLEFTRPDVIVIGSDVKGKGPAPLYQHITDNRPLSLIPLLLLCNYGEPGLPFPEEMLIPRPIDPKQFVDRVRALVSPTVAPQAIRTTGQASPLDDVGLEDDFLDAALSLDQIRVTDSEVMDKTQITKQTNPVKTPDEMVGLEHAEDNSRVSSDSGKIESLVIRENDSDIRHRSGRVAAAESMSASGKLEILSDQYGLMEPADLGEESRPGRSHDYEWFVSEMQKEGPSLVDTSAPRQPAAPTTHSDDLDLAEPSSIIDPITPPPSMPRQTKPAGVDKFIDEFKKEIEKIDVVEPASVTVEPDHKTPEPESDLSWQDSLEKLTPDGVGVFTRQFAAELAERLAEKIVSKIDNDKLLNLLKREISQEIKRHQKPSN